MSTREKVGLALMMWSLLVNQIDWEYAVWVAFVAWIMGTLMLVRKVASKDDV